MTTGERKAKLVRSSRALAGVPVVRGVCHARCQLRHVQRGERTLRPVRQCTTAHSPARTTRCRSRTASHCTGSHGTVQTTSRCGRRRRQVQRCWQRGRPRWQHLAPAHATAATSPLACGGTFPRAAWPWAAASNPLANAWRGGSVAAGNRLFNPGAAGWLGRACRAQSTHSPREPCHALTRSTSHSDVRAYADALPPHACRARLHAAAVNRIGSSKVRRLSTRFCQQRPITRAPFAAAPTALSCTMKGQREHATLGGKLAVATRTTRTTHSRHREGGAVQRRCRGKPRHTCGCVYALLHPLASRSCGNTTPTRLRTASRTRMTASVLA